MTVSVIIPAYNSGAFIAAAIDSVMRQTRPVSEIIVIDDGSTDSTREIVAAYPQIKMFSQNHQGPSAARNAGIHQARGQWVAFLDSDDLWYPEKIEKQLTALAAHPSAAFSFSTLTSFCSPDDAVISREPYMPTELRAWMSRRTSVDGSAYGNVYHLLLRTNCVHTSSVIALRGALLDVDLFDEKLTHGEDHDLWLRLSRRWPAVFIYDPMSQYRIHSSSVSGEAGRRQDLFYRSSIEILTKHRSAFPSFDAAKALAITYNGYATFQLKERQWAAAKRLAEKGLCVMPTPSGFRLWLEAAFPKAYSHAMSMIRGGQAS